MKLLTYIGLLLLLPVLVLSQTYDHVDTLDIGITRQYYRYIDSTYAVARGAHIADALGANGYFGQIYNQGGDAIHRTFRLSFNATNTLGLAASDTIKSATIKMGSVGHPANNFDILVYAAVDTVRESWATSAAYHHFSGWVDGGANTYGADTIAVGYPTGISTYFYFPLTSAGIDSLQNQFCNSPDTTFYFYLISKNDRLAIPATGLEHITVSECYLIINWNEGPIPPAPTPSVAAGDQIVGSRGAVLREATGHKTEAQTRNKKYISKARKKKKGN